MDEPDVVPALKKSCQADEITEEVVITGSDRAQKTRGDSAQCGDPALLHAPLLTSTCGVRQLLECFRTGTAQLKYLLLKEVNTIFECKGCRSLFRGLPNLIKHKQVYCVSPAAPTDEGTKSMKERLEGIYPCSDRQGLVLTLEPIAGNRNAVFQSLSREEEEPSASPQSPQHSTTSSWRPSDSEELHEDVLMEKKEEEAPSRDEEEETRSGIEDLENQTEDSDTDVEVQTSCKCQLCDRTYRAPGHLRRHLQAVHKISSSDSNTHPKSLKVLPRAHSSQLFDFNARFCKLCRRAFSTEQNLTKHVELHTDNGTDFFVMFFSCPLCRYKTRRKRDVLRHLTELHKKKSVYLRKISQSLHTYAVKKPAELVLNKHHTEAEEQKDFQRSDEVRPGLVECLRANRKTREASGRIKATRRSKRRSRRIPQSPSADLSMHTRSHQKSSAGGVRTRSRVLL